MGTAPGCSCRWLLALIVMLQLCGAVWAQDVAKETPPAERFADNIRSARTLAKSLNDEYSQMAGDLQPYLAYAGDDLAKTKEVYASLTSDLENAAAKWEQGDDVAATALFKKAQQGLAPRDVWRTRLTQWRRPQAELAPTEDWCRQNEAGARPAALPDFRRLVAAKKAAAEACGAVADATVPGADPVALNELKEKAYAARVESEIANWEYHWANRLDGMWFDKGVTKDEIEKPLAALLLSQQELIKLERERITHERRVREAQVALTKAEQGFGEAFWAAVRAREAAKAAPATAPSTAPAAEK